MYTVYVKSLHAVLSAPGRPRNSWIMQIGNGSPQLSSRHDDDDYYYLHNFDTF